MKSIISTKGAYGLLDPTTRDFIEQTPQVVTWTPFFEARAGKDQIKTWASGIPEEVTQKDWAEFLASDDADDTPMKDLVEIFLAAYGVETDEGEGEGEGEDEDRAALEAQATELELKFRKDISTERLQERVDEALAAKKKAEGNS